MVAAGIVSVAAGGMVAAGIVSVDAGARSSPAPDAALAVGVSSISSASSLSSRSPTFCGPAGTVTNGGGTPAGPICTVSPPRRFPSASPLAGADSPAGGSTRESVSAPLGSTRAAAGAGGATAALSSRAVEASASRATAVLTSAPGPGTTGFAVSSPARGVTIRDRAAATSGADSGAGSGVELAGSGDTSTACSASAGGVASAAGSVPSRCSMNPSSPSKGSVVRGGARTDACRAASSHSELLTSQVMRLLRARGSPCPSGSVRAQGRVRGRAPAP